MEKYNLSIGDIVKTTVEYNQKLVEYPYRAEIYKAEVLNIDKDNLVTLKIISRSFVSAHQTEKFNIGAYWLEKITT